jgi:probable F420-dependent oxidoreductase
MSKRFEVGAVFPTTEIETDFGAIRDYVQAIEDLGFDQLVAYDHVVGADISNRPDWDLSAHPFTHTSPFYEPIVLFSFAAGVTRRIKFLSGVIVLPQRQTVLFAKQAATLDVLCNGRLMLGIGLGWNKIEYDAVSEGMDFAQRAVRTEEQIRFLRRLWTEPAITEHDRFHKIDAAGINPLPIQRPIPILVGGGANVAMDRAVRLGDGWFPFFRVEEAEEKGKEFREALRRAGRDPAQVLFQNNVRLGGTIGGDTIRTVEDAVRDAEVWRTAGASGVCFSTLDMGLKTARDHIKMLREVSEVLGLKRRATQ